MDNLKFKVGDVLVTKDPPDEVDTYRFKIVGYNKSTDFYKIMPITFQPGADHYSFEQVYVENHCVIDKEHIWNEEIKDIING